MKQKPAWLTRIQENSWEPELFISGGAIFSLFQITRFLQKESFISFQQSGHYESILNGHLIAAALTALMLGFGLHLVIRGFWVGMVCLSYVFPNGIDIDKMEYTDTFNKKLYKMPDTNDLVTRLETLSSLAFSLSIFFFLVILGFWVNLALLIPHSSLQDTIGVTAFGILRGGSLFALTLGAVYLFDFLTLGYVKKQKSIAKIYYPIYVFFSITSLSFLYRGVYYTLITNIKAWKVMGFVLVYVTTTALIIFSNYGGFASFTNPHKLLDITFEKNEYNARYYEDERPEDDLVRHASIQSSIVKDGYIKLFLVHQKLLERTMSTKSWNSHSTEVGNDLADPSKLAYFSDFYQVKIDDLPIEKVRWKAYKHPKTGELGIIAFIPTQKLDVSEHHLSVQLRLDAPEKLEQLKKFGLEDDTYLSITFWKASE